METVGRAMPDMVGAAHPTKPMRQSMPLVTAFIDELREAFGAEEINAQIKLGIQGAETFHASENGIEVGTRFREPVKYITADKMVIRDKNSLIFSVNETKAPATSANPSSRIRR